MSQQLLLDVQLPDDATFANFVVGANAEVINFLKNTFCKRDQSYVYLWGSIGTGKTHLMQACCHEFSESDRSYFYLNLVDYKNLQPEVLQGLENYDLVCLDNLHRVCEDKKWQEALFYFYNRSQDQKRCLFITADKAPAELSLSLADLKSRLSWGLVLHLQTLDDESKLLMLQQHAANKGFQLSDEVCQYILNHHARDTHQLMQLLNRIDEQSLIAKRKITIPFLKTL